MASMSSLLSRAGQLAALLTRTHQGHMLTTRYQHRLLGSSSQMQMSSQDTIESQNSNTFNEKALEHLVCPLSKTELRYDKENSELVCDELGVAYPIVNGIPNLVPQDARMLKNSSDSTEGTES